MPIETGVQIRNIEQVVRVLRNVPAALDAAAEDTAKTFLLLAEGGTPVKTGYAQRSWGGVEKVTSGYSFRNAAPYIGVLEEGLYPNVGPRTVRVGDGIYSKKAAFPSLGIGGILQPLMEDEGLLERIAEQIIVILMREMEK